MAAKESRRGGAPMKRDFHILDVFTAVPYSGNPLAVVLDAEGLDTEQMQTIAREFNLSETVFVLPPENPVHSARLRIFTRFKELPFAGHPTIGTAVLLAAQKMGEPDREEDAIIMLEEGIGAVRVGVRARPHEAAFAEFDAVALPEELSAPPPADRLAAALGLAPNDIGLENHKPMRFSAGLAFTFVPVRGLEAMERIDINPQHWKDAFWDGDLNAAFVYCRQCIHTRSHFHARMFLPGLFGSEDAATGSAAAAFAGAIKRFDQPPEGVHTAVIEQGYEMGRPSEIVLELEMIGGRLKAVRIGGHAVPVMVGTLEA